MKKLTIAVFLACCFSSISAPVTAQSSQLLGICMTDSLTGKERKQLAQWIFFAIAAHPEIGAYANVSSEDRDKSDQSLGALVTRLLTDDCPDQAKAALKEGGPMAMQQAFEIVGAVAMQELMTDRGVVSAISGFEKYLDEEKFQALAPN